jgi:hypothetical protein
LNLEGKEGRFQIGYNIYLENFKGFSFNTNPFNSFSKRGSALRIQDSDFDFYLNGETSLGLTCLFTPTLQNMPLLSNFDAVILSGAVNTSVYQCPLIFQNANIKSLILNHDLTDKNKLAFRPLVPGLNDVSKLNSKIESFEIQNSFISFLDSSLLNREIFKDMQKFTFVSLASTVNLQDNLFQSFKMLKEFNFNVANMETYIRNQNLTWALSLNSEVKIDLKNETEVSDPLNKDRQFKLSMVDLGKSYVFPESDFCTYSGFPHDQLVFPIINTKPDLECSCTLAWLLQYSQFYKDQDEIMTSSVANCLSDMSNFTEIVRNCNFETKVRECDPTTSAPETSVKTTPKPQTTTTTVQTVVISSGLGGGAIAGIVIGSLAAVALIGAGGFFLYKYKIKPSATVMPAADNHEMSESI